MVTTVLYDADRKTARRCGGCTLCCKILPVRELAKPANTRCQHQRTGKGCAVYARLAQVSPACVFWSCRWPMRANGGTLS